MSQVKDQAQKFLDEFPEDATWDDLLDEFYLRRKVELGLTDLEQGRAVSQEEIEKNI